MNRYQKKKSEYNERIKRGAEDSQTEDEYINEMEGLKEMLDESEVYAKAAQKELDRRAKAEEAAAKAAEKKAAADDRLAEKLLREEQKIQDQENKDNEMAFEKLQKFTRSENLDRFQKELGSMKPADLRRTGLDLLKLQEQLKQKYKDQLEDADLKGAENTYNELEDTQSRLGMI